MAPLLQQLMKLVPTLILRDHKGRVIFAACRWLFNCHGPLEAELAACEEGLRLFLHWSQAPLVVETDCTEIVSLINAGTVDQFRNMYQVAEIVGMLKERQTHVRKISRTQNKAAHAMAAVERGQQRTAWLMYHRRLATLF